MAQESDTNQWELAVGQTLESGSTTGHRVPGGGAAMSTVISPNRRRLERVFHIPSSMPTATISSSAPSCSNYLNEVGGSRAAEGLKAMGARVIQNLAVWNDERRKSRRAIEAWWGGPREEHSRPSNCAPAKVAVRAPRRVGVRFHGALSDLGFAYAVHPRFGVAPHRLLSIDFLPITLTSSRTE